MPVDLVDFSFQTRVTCASNVATARALKNLNLGQPVFISGYTTAGDGSGGLYSYTPATVVDDGINNLSVADGGGLVKVSTGAAINLNFSLSALSQTLSFTRATTATVQDHLGVIQSCLPGELRFKGLRRISGLPTGVMPGPAYYGAYVDGVQYSSLDDSGVLIPEVTREGVLIEEARTNLLLNSTIGGTNLATQGVTVAAVAHTLSFYGTGTVTLSGASTAGPLVGSGAFPTRSAITFTPTAGTLTLTVTGSVQFAQLEVGAFATSHIPTAGTAVTRNAESLSFTLPPSFSAVQGTWFADVTKQGVLNSLILEGAGTTGTTFAITAGAGTGMRMHQRHGGFRGDMSSGVAYSAGTRVKMAMAKPNSALPLASDGGTTATAGAVPAQANYGTTMFIGSRDGTSLFYNNTIRAIRWYSRAMTQSQLNAMTT